MCVVVSVSVSLPASGFDGVEQRVLFVCIAPITHHPPSIIHHQSSITNHHTSYRNREPLLASDSTSLSFEEAVLAPKVATIDFEFKDLGLRLASGKPVLQGVTGSIRFVACDKAPVRMCMTVCGCV